MMRSSTLLLIQTLAVIGYLACATPTVDAANACCKGTCHTIPKGCHCPYKSVLCGELSALTMGKRNSEVGGMDGGGGGGGLYENEQMPPSSQQTYRLGKLEERTDRRVGENRVIGVLNNLLRHLKETHQAEQDAFQSQTKNNNDGWETVTSSRKQTSDHAHNVYSQPIYMGDIF